LDGVQPSVIGAVVSQNLTVTEKCATIPAQIPTYFWSMSIPAS